MNDAYIMLLALFIVPILAITSPIWYSILIFVTYKYWRKLKYSFLIWLVDILIGLALLGYAIFLYGGN